MNTVGKECRALCGKTKTASEYRPEIRSFRNHLGDAVITTYPAFPGIELAYWSVHMERFSFGPEQKGNFMEIHHCREGRMEQELNNGSFYIMPGDLSVTVREHGLGDYSFPLSHYHGIPVSAYIRILKMQSAAARLIRTDTAILEIAAEFGYSNAGKFAFAFQKIMGETPGEYRKIHGEAL